MDGPEILVETMSVARTVGTFPVPVNYHPRSDHHSKVACWGIAFDLLQNCPLLRQHVLDKKVGFGINHRIVDFSADKHKDLDLVISTVEKPASGRDLQTVANDYGIQLTPQQTHRLQVLPQMREAPCSQVLVTLEAKACMTAFAKALPRLFDELNSSQQIVHGASSHTLAAGLVMINTADEFFSPTQPQNSNPHPGQPAKMNLHKQPDDARKTLETVKKLPRRSTSQPTGYDAVGVLMVDCKNDGRPVRLDTALPAPQPGDQLRYEAMINRIATEYMVRFASL